jgi:outer membrane protein TolC
MAILQTRRPYEVRGALMTTRRNLCLILGLLSLFGGCTAGPDYVRPAAEVPAAYKEIEGWKAANPRDHVIRGAWWKTFNDPYLNGLEDQVDISNQTIAVAEAQLRQARALVGIARAGYFPMVSIGAAHTRSFNLSSAGGSAQGSSGVIMSDYGLPGAVSWGTGPLGPCPPYCGIQPGQRPGE